MECEVEILEEKVGDCHEVGNHELGEAHVDNDIAENLLEHHQYELPRRNANIY